jgi:hypothetical protein
MADDNTTTSPSDRSHGSGRGYRQGGNRDSGGLRIRLSDNEMRAARALQDAFGLRSTVAVLGFSLRTLAQQLEQGQLEELVRQHRAQAGSRPPGGRGGERRRDRSEGVDTTSQRAPRIDPLARPSKPSAAALSEPEPTEAHEPGESTIEPDAIGSPGGAMAADEASDAMADTAPVDVPQDEEKSPAAATSGTTASESEGGV